MIAPLQKIHTWSIEETKNRLKTSNSGLTELEVHKRQSLYGKNTLEEETLSPVLLLVRQFNSPLIFILFAASLISLFLREFTDFFIVIGLLVINGVIGFWQEWKAQASLASLKKLTETKNIVIRGGKRKLIPASELVPGDVVVLHQGEVVTADVRLIECLGLLTDESLITGESTPILKNLEQFPSEDSLPFEWTNMVLTGSTVVRGKGHGIVVRTGKDTYLASIEEKAKAPAPPTPLQMALRSFVKKYVLLILTFLGIMAAFGSMQGRSFIELSYVLLACLVSAVPEGLPIVVTLVMLRGALLLRKQQTLVRDLPAVETLGSTTVIATDKTGTITEGRLSVQDVYTQDLPKLQQIGALCNESKEGLGDPLDIALVEWAKNAYDLQVRYPKKWELPFDSTLMLMATIHTIEGGNTLYVKGAYEVLREKASNTSELEAFDAASHVFVKKGYRVIACAESRKAVTDPKEWQLHIVGLIGFIDPPKKGVHGAVLAAKKAGLHVIMITGDHPTTAQTIAQEVGIWKQHDLVLTGKEIEILSDDELLEQLKKTTVLARILPEHKFRVVQLLQKQKEIVAVTGDGVNDIPALKAAHIGIAMGTGSEAAKSVSQMVLVDNNFSVIVDAIRNARVIATNLRKVIYYLVSTSTQELVFLLFSILSDMPLCLSAIQILWLNLVTDGILDKTFPFLKEEGNVMKQAPQNVETTFLNPQQIKSILFFGLTQGGGCFALYYFLYPIYPFETVSTMVFTSMVLSQWANALQAQKEREPFFHNIKLSFTINPHIFLAMIVSLLLQCSVLYIFHPFFNTVPLTITQWVSPIMIFCFAFFLIELRLWIDWRKQHQNRPLG